MTDKSPTHPPQPSLIALSEAAWDGWISVHDELPERGELVWCCRSWIPGHITSDGIRRYEVRLAARESDRPLTIHEDLGRDSFWRGHGEHGGHEWSDATTSHWKRITKPTPPAPVGGFVVESRVPWQPGNTVPNVPHGDEQYFLVAVRRKYELGKVWSFPAQFLNNKKLLCVEDDPVSRKGNGWCQVPCDEGEDADILVTGWYMESSTPDAEYDTEYRQLLSDGDELVAWAEIPQYAASPAAQSSAKDGVRVESQGWYDPKGEATFKNFHRSLCDRFGYTHDPEYWWRDLISLEEHIAKATTAAGLVDGVPMIRFDGDAVEAVVQHLLTAGYTCDGDYEDFFMGVKNGMEAAIGREESGNG